MVVNACFLGKPQVVIDGIPVTLEQTKVCALLLYVLFNGSSTRDELAGLLWCDCPGENARRNLRNSLHKLKAMVGDKFLVAKGHSLVRVSDSVTLHRDVDLFITENSQSQLFSLDSYTFLKHFYVKNCPEFDRWITSMQNAYEKLIVKRFTKELQSSILKGADNRTEYCAARILEIDAYNEEACRALMEVNLQRGDYNTATAHYQRLKKALAEELDIAPEAETERLFQQLLEAKRSVQHVVFSVERQRDQALVEKLDYEYHSFRLGQRVTHYILSGDIGMGKSQVLHAFLERVSRRELIDLTFQLPYRGVPFYGAERLVDALSKLLNVKLPREFEPDRGNGALYYCKVLNRLFEVMWNQKRFCVLALQNLEAIDRASMDIFMACLFENVPNSLFVISEYCPNFEEDTKFLDKIALLPHFQLLQFPLLDERASAAYLRKHLDRQFHQDKIIQEGYECTGGNLLLLQEFVHNIENGISKPYTLSAEGSQMVSKLLSSLSREETRVLEILAVLEAAEVETIAQMMQLPSIQVIQVLDDLSRRGWIYEREESGHLLLRDRFGLIETLLYERMPQYKRMELHRIALDYYEHRFQQNSKDLFYLTQLCLHSSHTYNAQKKIFYHILHLERVLDYFDEFFPTIVDDIIQYNERWLISREETYARFQQYSAELHALEDKLPSSQYYELLMKLYFLQGRAMIRGGQREAGLNVINDLVVLAKKLDRDDMLMKGYVEILCYAVRAEDTALMRQYIDLAFEIENFEKYEKENGVFLRLQGYLHLLNGQYEDAERCLKESIAIFERPKLRSANYFNIAGAYDYLALNSRRQMKLDDALGYIRKAIDLCVEKKVQKSLDLFYEDCGYILFLKGDRQAAERYFLKSIELYEQFDTYWLRSIAESCLAMIYAASDSGDRALEHFRKAEVFSQKEMAQEELTVLEQARCELKRAGIL